jgi:hypothetical protein
MKKFKKFLLVAIPALVVAAAVGMTTIGCGDDTTSTTTGNDLAVKTGGDMAKGTTPADMTSKTD